VPTILVVDDEKPIREAIAIFLELDGYKVIVANNGVEALQAIAEERPDLILCDVMMPVLDGRELCRCLKADKATRSIPIILMSAAGRNIVGDVGADGYIEKPLDLTDLPEMIDRWST
jgi:two-component system, OmpR family, alkaline phosphatase synthesis response regulator PhoP